MKSAFRGAMRRTAALALVPLGLAATVRVSHAIPPETAAALHNAADEGVAVVTAALSGVRLFANPAASAAKRDADAIRAKRPNDAALLDRIASQPVATWIGDWERDLRGTVSRITSLAASNGTVPVLVAYNIPNRDCGSHSAGGARDAQGYGRWIREFAAGLGGRHAVVVLEPDAVAQTSCLDAEQREARLGMLRDAVGVLKGNGARVYVDAGNARWMKPADMAGLLRRSAIDKADGFALNVSNFIPNAESIRYGQQISSLLGSKHFIIDTSRNGVGGNGEWCNPKGQGLGALPTTNTGHPLVDAFLWIKVPGQSDGACNGGPRAGEWWTDYALELARNQPAQFAMAAH
jgi:endoglucanase